MRTIGIRFSAVLDGLRRLAYATAGWWSVQMRISTVAVVRTCNAFAYAALADRKANVHLLQRVQPNRDGTHLIYRAERPAKWSENLGFSLNAPAWVLHRSLGRARASRF
jgi:hypothetical protein